MITLRQLEALHWIAELGSFKSAAKKLNTTQSAISKRVQELETACGFAAFDRHQRSARLTEKGEHLLALSRDVLGLLDRIAELRTSNEMPARRLRVGVTELTALTWLSRLVTAVRAEYPNVEVEPDVDTSRNLYERLQNYDIDIVIIPEAFSDADITSVRVGQVLNAWMAKPGLVKTKRVLTLDELARYPILTQGGSSVYGVFLNKWLRSKGVALEGRMTSNSLAALVGLTVAGLGVSYLPMRCYRSLIDEGKLISVRTKPALPAVPYVAMYRNDRPSSFMRAIALIARAACDFGLPPVW